MNWGFLFKGLRVCFPIGFGIPLFTFEEMGTEETAGNMGFQHRNGDSILNCPPSGMNTTNPFLGSGWEPHVTLSQTENFGGSFDNSNYSHLVHYPDRKSVV